MIRPYERGDEDQIVELLRLCIEGWPGFDLKCTPKEHWKWKYLDNPYGMISTCVAVNEGEIVGVNHAIPLRIKIMDEMAYCLYAADTVVHPDFRGKGISTSLRKTNIANSEEKGFKYVFFVTSNPILIKSFEKIRPRLPHQIGNLVKIKDIELQLEAMPVNNPTMIKWGYRTLNLLNNIRSYFSKIRTSSSSKIRRVETFDDNYRDFWEETRTQYDYIIERNVDYMNWRFCDNRAGDFVVHVAEEDDTLLGYSVVRVNRVRPEYPIGFLVDLIVRNGRTDVISSLVSNALSYFNSEKVNIISCQFIKNHVNHKILSRHGFIDSRIPVQIFCNPFGVNEEFPKIRSVDPNRVYYSYGDIDSIPTNIPRYS
jgi:GNAT superfamily N-acetyltransferase